MAQYTSDQVMVQRVQTTRTVQDARQAFIVNAAAGLVRAFRPTAVYPYHFRNSDGSLSNLEEFRRQVQQALGGEARP